MRRIAALAFIAVAYAGCAATADTVDGERSRAAALLARGQSAEAYALYTSLLAANPDDDNLLYGQAVAAVSAGRARDAVAAFDTLLARHPHDAQLRIEAATAHRLAGNVSRAGGLIESIAPSQMAEFAERYGIDTAVRGMLPSEPYYATRGPAPTKPTQLRGGFRMGVVYDTNANQGPASDSLVLGYFPLTFDGAKEKSSAGAYAGLNLDFQHVLCGGNSPWAVVGDLNLFIRANERQSLSDQKAREWQYGRVAGGMRYYGSDYFFDARAKAEVVDYQLTNRVAAFGAELSFVKSLNGGNIFLISQGSLEWRDYNRSSYRNGVYGEIGQFARFFFGHGENRPYLTIGGKYIGGDADDGDYSFSGWQAQARFTMPIGCRLEVSPHVSYTEEYYRGPGAPGFEFRKRKDETWRAGVDVTVKLTDSWSVEASYMYRHNYSRSALYTYDQQMVSLGIAKTF